jgi:hypothetical protein
MERHKMSRANASITPLSNGSIAVTFALRQGGEATYFYSGDSAAYILGGGDPKDVPYDDGGVGVDASDVPEAGTAGEISDIAAIGELGAL